MATTIVFSGIILGSVLTMLIRMKLSNRRVHHKLSVGGCEKPSQPLLLYVAVAGRGILTLSFNPSKPANESLKIMETNTQGGFRPQWITTFGHKLYSVSRTQYPSASDTNEGGVFAFRGQGRNGPMLRLLNSVGSGGDGGVSCDVTRDGRTCAVANIKGSTVSVYSLSREGVLGSATYVFKNELKQPGPGAERSQVQSNPHQACFDPSGEFMFVPDRGADSIVVYHVAGPYIITRIETITLESGTGPRHITFQVFDAQRTYMYLVNELDNTVCVFTLDGVCNRARGSKKSVSANVKISLKQTISTLGLGFDRSAPDRHNLASEVAFSFDGRFAYVSNRETTSYASDNIAIFSVQPGRCNDSQHLAYVGKTTTYGKTPRHFSLSKDTQSRYLAVANQVSNSIVILERDRTSGAITGIKGKISLGDFDMTMATGPTCVLWR